MASQRYVLLLLHFIFLIFLCFCQFFMPISSFPASMPSALCHVVWVKTHLCISSLARPWCTQKRQSLSRDESLSSITLTVSSFLHFLQTLPQLCFLFLFLDLIMFVFSPGSFFLFCSIPPSPSFIFSSPHSLVF